MECKEKWNKQKLYLTIHKSFQIIPKQFEGDRFRR